MHYVTPKRTKQKPVMISLQLVLLSQRQRIILLQMLCLKNATIEWAVKTSPGKLTPSRQPWLMTITQTLGSPSALMKYWAHSIKPSSVSQLELTWERRVWVQQGIMKKVDSVWNHRQTRRATQDWDRSLCAITALVSRKTRKTLRRQQGEPVCLLLLLA